MGSNDILVLLVSAFIGGRGVNGENLSGELNVNLIPELGDVNKEELLKVLEEASCTIAEHIVFQLTNVQS